MITYKQLDLFGGEIDVNKIDGEPRKVGRRKIKDEFRFMYGFNKEHRCKECEYFVRATYNRTYFKCEKMGISSSVATDIRANDYACKLFKKIGEKE